MLNKNVFLNNYNTYSYLLDSYLDYYRKSDQSSGEVIYRLSLYKQIIEQLCLFDKFQYQKPVLMDEGPLNHHPDLPVKLDPDSVKPIGIVFCNLDSDQNFERIKEREKSRGRPSPLHRGLNDKQLKELIAVHQQNYLKKKEKIRAFDIPNIEINLSEPREENYIRVSNFFESQLNP